MGEGRPEDDTPPGDGTGAHPDARIDAAREAVSRSVSQGLAEVAGSKAVASGLAALDESAIDRMGGNLFNSAPVSIVITDPNQPDNPIVFVNSSFERVTGFSRASALGRNCRFLQGEDHDQPGVHELRRAVEARESTEVEIRNYSALGEMFTNRLHISPVFADGELIAFIGMQVRLPGEDGRDDARAVGARDFSRHMRGARPSRREAALRARALEDRDTIDHLELLLAESNQRMRAHLRLLAGLVREPGMADSSDLARELLSHRVEALSLLYDDLETDTSGALAAVVSGGEYVSKVVATLSAMDPRQKVRFNVQTDPCLLGIDRAALLGLFTSEVVTVLLSEVEGRAGHSAIDVELRELASNRAELRIDTDIPGTPAEDNPLEIPTTSQRIIDGLVARLGGTLGVDVGEARAGLRLEFGQVV